MLVVEVASPGTTAIDATDKLDDYQAQGDIRLILFVDPDVVSIKLYWCDGEGPWQAEKYDSLDQSIDLPKIAALLSLGDICATLDPETRPRLGLVEEPAQD